MKSNPLVYIVTPVFNGREHTRKYLSSLRKQTYKSLKVVIIDDASTDGTLKMIKNNFPEVHTIKGDGDLWWSGGTNMGAKFAIANKADFVLTLNNDLVVGNDYVEKLIETAKMQKRSLIGSMVCYVDNPSKVWYYGARFGKNGDMDHVSGYKSSFNSSFVSSEWLTGMGVLIPVGVFKKIGYFDRQNFPQYFGDADFSLRAARAGYNLLVVSKAIVYGDMSSSWVHRQLEKPKLKFFWDLFFSIRSPYQIRTRFKFYREYWPKHYKLALFRLYAWTLKGLYASFFIIKAKKLLGINKPLRKKNSK